MSKTVVHLIIDLDKGGVETMLYQVLNYQMEPECRDKEANLGTAHIIMRV